MLLGLGSAATSWAPDDVAFAPGKTLKLPDIIVGSDGIARTATPGSSFLDKILPVKTDAKGNARIYGLPPALTYSIVVILLGGSAYYAYQTWGHHLVIRNPLAKKRGRPRGRLKQ